MSKAKKGPRPPAKTAVYTPKRPGSSSWVWWVAGGALALIGVVVIVLAAGGSGGGGSGCTGPQGIECASYPGNQHVPAGTATWDRVPPMGGQHNATPLNCGIYDQQVNAENAVHSLEHGALWITYDPGLPEDQVAILRNLITSKYKAPDRRLMLSPYSALPAPVVASAWGRQLKLLGASDPRLAEFIDTFLAKPTSPEPGAACQGTGNPVG